MASAVRSGAGSMTGTAIGSREHILEAADPGSQCTAGFLKGSS